MAATGGDTVVPTNWGGLIMVAVIVAVIAAATYFGMEYQFGASDTAPQAEESLSVKDVFSAAARREIAAAEPARVLSRAELAASNTSDGLPPADDDAVSDMPDDGPMSDGDAASDQPHRDSPPPGSSEAEDDGDSSDEQWDTTTDDWDSEPAQDTMAAAPPSPPPATPKPTAKPAAATPKPTSESAARAPQRPSAEALTAWWNDAGGKLSVRFVGPLDKGGGVSDGIAVMFSEPVNAEQGNQHLRLTDESGKAVTGNWTSGANPMLLLIDGLKPGRYQLSIGAAITSRGGNKLASDASGPVYVY